MSTNKAPCRLEETKDFLRITKATLEITFKDNIQLESLSLLHKSVDKGRNPKRCYQWLIQGNIKFKTRSHC